MARLNISRRVTNVLTKHNVNRTVRICPVPLGIVLAAIFGITGFSVYRPNNMIPDIVLMLKTLRREAMRDT